VLAEYPRYKKLLENRGGWREQRSLPKQETFLDRLEKIPVIGRVITDYFPAINLAK
jgi:hypothetical protein